MRNSICSSTTFRTVYIVGNEKTLLPIWWSTTQNSNTLPVLSCWCSDQTMPKTWIAQKSGLADTWIQIQVSDIWMCFFRKYRSSEWLTDRCLQKVMFRFLDPAHNPSIWLTFRHWQSPSIWTSACPSQTTCVRMLHPSKPEIVMGFAAVKS